MDEQLAKLHNQRTVLPQQPVTQQAQTFSEAVRQSPTTVQPTTAAVSTPTTVPQQNAQQQQVTVSSPPKASIEARRPSRFMVSKVIEEAPKTQQSPQFVQNIQTQNVINPTLNLIHQQQLQQPQTISKSTISSPETEQQMQQRSQQPQPQQDQIVTSQQAQNFFILHQGGMVSSICMLLRLLFFIL